MTGRALGGLRNQHVEVRGGAELGLLGRGYVLGVQGGALRLATHIQGPVAIIIDLADITLVERIQDKRALQPLDGGQVHKLRQPAPTC